MKITDEWPLLPQDHVFQCSRMTKENRKQSTKDNHSILDGLGAFVRFLD